MMARARPVYRVIFLLVLAPVGAAVTIGALLLFGVDPTWCSLLVLPSSLD